VALAYSREGNAQRKQAGTSFARSAGEVKKEKKKPNPQRACIFCGDPANSKEHVFAEWMHPYLPSPKGVVSTHKPPHTLQVTKISHDGTTSVEPPRSGQFNRPGEMKSKRLRVVCKPCNNEWMSVLQTTAKPILLPFIQGTWATLTPASQRILAAWITGYAMVAEKSGDLSEAFTQAQRKEFKDQGDTREPRKNCLIWIFANHDEYNPSSFGIRIVDASKVSQVTADIDERKSYASITIFSLNRLGVVAINVIDDEVFSLVSNNLTRLASQLGLRLLWPINSALGPPGKPTRTLAVGESRDFIEAVSAILRLGISTHLTGAPIK
jgi:hypothetical protein